MRPYAVLGAGAVGSSLAAYLARRGHPVLLVARPRHVEAVRAQGGIRAVSRTETFLAPVRAEAELPSPLPPATVLFLTVQVPDLDHALEIAGPAAAGIPAVTWQNGIRAEELAAPRFPHLLGGVVRFTSTLLVPGEVRLRGPGALIVGRWPAGEDPLAGAIATDLSEAGFRAAASPDIRADKALKLLVNLVSGPAVLVRRTGKEPALARVQAALLEEALRVYAAAGIEARPAGGIGEPPEQLLAHFRAGGSAPDTAGDIYNSTWQNLHHRRPRLENDAYHGEIVRLGEGCGVPAPVNRRVLDLLEEVRERGLGPEPYSPAEFADRLRDLLPGVDAPLAPLDPSSSAPEI